MNLVMTEDGNCVELQATAERHAFPRSRLLEMMDCAEAGIHRLHDLQKGAIAAGGRTSLWQVPERISAGTFRAGTNHPGRCP